MSSSSVIILQPPVGADISLSSDKSIRSSSRGSRKYLDTQSSLISDIRSHTFSTYSLILIDQDFNIEIEKRILLLIRFLIGLKQKSLTWRFKFCVLFTNYLYLHFENPSAMKQSTLMRFCRLWSFSITSESLSCKACFGSFFHLIRKQITKTINVTKMLFLWGKFLSTCKSFTLKVSWQHCDFLQPTREKQRNEPTRCSFFNDIFSTEYFCQE